MDVLNASTRQPVERALEAFLSRCVRPDAEEGNITTRRAQWLQERLHHPPFVASFYSGSFARNTAVRGSHDVDLFAVQSGEADVEDMEVLAMFQMVSLVLTRGGDVQQLPDGVDTYLVKMPNAEDFLLRRQHASAGICFAPPRKYVNSTVFMEREPQTEGGSAAASGDDCSKVVSEEGVSVNCSDQPETWPEWSDSSVTFDIVPALSLGDSRFMIKVGLTPVVTNPKECARLVDRLDKTWEGQFTDLVRLIKYWNNRNAQEGPDGSLVKPMKSFHLELICCQYAQKTHRKPMSIAIAEVFDHLEMTIGLDAGVAVPGLSNAYIANHPTGERASVMTHERILALVRAGRDAAHAALDLMFRSEPALSVQKWSEIFGSEFLDAAGSALGPGLQSDERSPRARPNAESDGDANRNAKKITMVMPGRVDAAQEGSHDVNASPFSGVATLIGVACYQGNAEAVRFLASLGANVNSSVVPGVPPPLTLAVSKRHYDVVSVLLECGADVNAAADQFTRSALFTAALHNSPRIVDLLIHSGADVHEGHPLAAAASCGSESAVRALLQAGANPNVIEEGIWNASPLYIAAHGGHDGVCRALVDAGGNCELGDGAATPLYAACRVGNVGVVKVLVEAGASRTEGKGYVTPLMVAATCGFTDVIKALLDGTTVEQWCEPGAPTEDDSSSSGDSLANKYQGRRLSYPLSQALLAGHISAARTLIEFGFDVNGNGRESTPLFHACYGSHLSGVEMLLESCDLEIDKPMPRSNRTALHVAAIRSAEMVGLLLRRGANPNMLDDRGVTALHEAAKEGDLESVRLLLDHAADPNLASKKTSPLLAAVIAGHSSVVRELLQHGANVEFTVEHTNMTPLLRAAERGCLEVLRALVDGKANVRAQLLNGYTALHVAAFNGHTDAVKFLLDHGLECTIAGHDLVAPLHLAVSNGHTRTVRALLSATPADQLNAAASDGETPIYTASRHGYVDIVRLLATHGADVNLPIPIGTPPLGAAVINEHRGACSLLLEHGADANVEISATNDTCLLLALRQPDDNSFAIALELIRRMSKSKLDHVNQENHSALLLACNYGAVDVVRELLDRGVDANRVIGGRTGLLMAINGGHFACVRVLVERVPGCIALSSEVAAVAPLTIAASNAREDIVKVLLEGGAPLISSRLPPPLMALSSRMRQIVVEHLKSSDEVDLARIREAVAVYKANGARVAKLLLSAGADASIGMDGRTPVHCAVELDNAPVLEALLETNPPSVAYNGREPIHVAVLAGSVECVKVLAANGADVNALSADKATPLRLAVATDNVEMLHVLLKHGADPLHGEVHAFMHAAALGPARCLEALVEHYPSLVTRFGKCHVGVTCNGCMQSNFSGTRYRHKRDDMDTDYCDGCFQVLLARSKVTASHFTCWEAPKWLISTLLRLD